VRDKIAASRAKGKWTGGSVPLGYDVKDKKLIPDPAEQKTVRYIFNRYLEVKSFSRLVVDLDARKIVTKRRNTNGRAAQNGGIPFTYGPLAYLLRNRLYIGETGHGGRWYPGEHEPILSSDLFDKVQAQLARNAIDRPKRRSQSGSLLMGKLFDDRGNVMSPSYSTKNGVRYRFYVSSALLRGRKSEAGSLSRVSAKEIEEVVLGALTTPSANASGADTSESVTAIDEIDRVTLSRGRLLIAKKATPGKQPTKQIEVPWLAKSRLKPTSSAANDPFVQNGDDRLLQAIVRARAWCLALQKKEFESIEELASQLRLHPKIVRQQLRFTFLDPRTIESAITGSNHISSAARLEVPLRWTGLH
jgi:hypothetical protein